jgi:hypothetical protein
MLDKSFANGNKPDQVSGLGARPREAAVMSTTHWELVLGVSPGTYAG